MAEAKEIKTAFIAAKCLAKSQAKKGEFTTVSPDGHGVFCIAKQMNRTNQDIVGENCVCNDAGELALTDKDKMKAWVEHYARLLDVEFEWPSNELPSWGPSNCWPPPACLQLWSSKHSAKWNATKLLAHLASWLRCWKLLVRKELSRRDNWQRLFSAAVWSHHTGSRASFWTSIRTRVKLLTVANILGAVSI